MADSYDVLVMGAGPAGVSAAVHLARAGFSVALLDKAVFPRDKTCGDALSAAALDCLDNLGALERVRALPHALVDQARLISPGGRELKARLAVSPAGRRQALVLPRKDLDHALAVFAGGFPNIRLIQDFRVERLCGKPGAVTGVEGTRGRSRSRISGRCLVGADGVFSAAARASGLFPRTRGNPALGLRAYFAGAELPQNAYTMFYARELLPCFAWIFPLPGGRANVGIWLAGGDPSQKLIRQRFFDLVRRNPVFSRALAGAEMIPGSFRGRPLAGVPPSAPRGRGNLLLAGDAGGFCDPASGEGIYHALKSGELAARAVSLAAAGQQGFSAAAREYERLWRPVFYTVFLAGGQLVTRLLGRPLLAESAFVLARNAPALFSPGLAFLNFFRKK